MRTEFWLNHVKGEYEKRCARNPRYSLRAYARSLGMDAGALSRVLSGKRIPSQKMAERMLEHLDLDPKDQRTFFESLKTRQQLRNLKRQNPFFRQMRRDSTVAEIEIDKFAAIAEWYHYAILELTFVEHFRPDISWIASELSITPTQAKLAVERLFRLGLLEEKGGRWVKTREQLTTADKHLTSPALRAHQRQILEKGMASLDSDPIQLRNMTSMTMSIDPEKIPVAKLMIEQFTLSLCTFLESSKRKRVYALGINLFPVQKSRQA